MTLLLGLERMTRPLNHMKMFLAPDELRPFVENWPDVANALMVRARHEAMAAPLDLALQSTWRELVLPALLRAGLRPTQKPRRLCGARHAACALVSPPVRPILPTSLPTSFPEDAR